MNSSISITLASLMPWHENVVRALNSKRIYNMDALLKKTPTEIKEVCFENKDPLAWIAIIDLARECGYHLSDDFTWTDFNNARRLSKAPVYDVFGLRRDHQYLRVVQILINNRITMLGDIIELPPSFIPKIEYISNKRCDIITQILNMFGYYVSDNDTWVNKGVFSMLTPEEMNRTAERFRKRNAVIYNACKYTGCLTKETIERVEGKEGLAS